MNNVELSERENFVVGKEGKSQRMRKIASRKIVEMEKSFFHI
jgi:hypothetical protein